MASDIYSMTPGSAVAETVQALLQRRRDEQRQLLLDQLGVEKFKSDQSERDRRFGLDETVQKQNIAESQERMLGDQIKSLGFGESEANPELVGSDLGKELIKRGRIQSRPGATPRVGTSTDVQIPENATPQQIEAWAQQVEGQNAVPTGTQLEDAGPAGPSKWMFTGNEKFQEAEDARNRMGSMIEGHPEMFKDNPELKNTMIMQQAGANVTPPSSLLEPAPSTRLIGPQGKDVGTIQHKRNEKPLELNWSPAAYSGGAAANALSMYQIPDGKGGFESVWLKPGQTKDQGISLNAPAPVQKGNMPAEKPLVPPTVWNQLTTATRVRGRVPQAVYEQGVRQARAAVAGNLSTSVSPNVKAFLNQAINDYNQREAAGKVKTPGGYLNDAQKSGVQFTPEELAQIEQVMSGIISGIAPAGQ